MPAWSTLWRSTQMAHALHQQVRSLVAVEICQGSRKHSLCVTGRRMHA